MDRDLLHRNRKSLFKKCIKEREREREREEPGAVKPKVITPGKIVPS